jgi:hypothetical protein
MNTGAIITFWLPITITHKLEYKGKDDGKKSNTEDLFRKAAQ